MTPSVSMTNVVRSMPMRFFPYEVLAGVGGEGDVGGVVAFFEIGHTGTKLPNEANGRAIRAIK
jgi:hypothetical protein